MSNPKKKDVGQRMANAPECNKQHSTYVFRAGEDECLSPAVVDRLASIAQATGKPITALSHMSRAQLCNIQPHKHWNGSKCIQDKPAQATDSGVKTPASDPSPTGDINLAPNGKSWDSYCASLGRATTGHCGACKTSSNMLYGTDGYGWRKCVPKSSICEQGGGTKACTVTATAGGCDTYDLSCQPINYVCYEFNVNYGFHLNCPTGTNTAPTCATGMHPTKIHFTRDSRELYFYICSTS